MTCIAYRLLLAVALGTIAFPAAAQDKTNLAGNWTVDLRPSPQAPAYLKPMTLVLRRTGR